MDSGSDNHSPTVGLTGALSMWPFRRKARMMPEADSPDHSMQVLAVLSPDQQISVGGLPNEAIAGTVHKSRRGHVEPTFRPNPAFSAFMQKIIGSLGRNDPDLRAAAKRQVNGSVAVIDLRTPEGVTGRVPLVDIVGIFEVHNGQLGAYHANDKHLVFSVNGLVQLPPGLRDLHIRELLRLKVETT